MAEDRFADIHNEKKILDKACEEIDREYYGNGETSCENIIEFLRNSPTAAVTFSQRRWITKIQRLAEKYPNEFRIIHTNRNGSIVAYIPVSAIKISRRPTRVLTEEQKQAAKERLAAARLKRYGDAEVSAKDLAELEQELEDELEDET